ncbi:MAG TPA: 50S ribosomal protein L10 [Tepidisphaeraceae bacterium]|jgi:large subunit ribosomal protein L10|nr:50S ribosomal protein L10 [Tepidisphaeraceae bacterium]
MSKKVKSLIEKELNTKLGHLDAVAVVNPRGLNATKNNALRRKLHGKGAKMTVVKNTLAKRAVGDGKLKGFDALLDGPSAVIYGNVSISQIARLLVDEKKLDPTLDLRGIFFDGEIYTGEKGIEKVSKLPTREEAIGQLVTLVLSPGKNLAGTLKSQAGKVASLIKAIEEKKQKEGGAAAAPEAASEAAPAA